MQVRVDSNLSCGIVQVFDLSNYQRKSGLVRLIDATHKYIYYCCGVSSNYDGWDSTRITDAHRAHAVSTYPARPHFVWSDYRPNGKELADSLVGYGKIWVMGPHRNDNTGHMITTWMFAPNAKFHEKVGWNYRGNT